MLSYNLFRIALVGVLALLLVRPAAAAIAPVTSPVLVWGHATSPSGSQLYSTAQLYCDTVVGYVGIPAQLDTEVIGYGGAYGYRCAVGWAPNTTYPINQRTKLYQNGTVTACPANSTGTSSCVCDAGYQEDAGHTFCELIPPVVCPASGTLHSDGFFNVGTIPTGSLLNTACVSSCRVNLISGFVPAATQILDGVKHYFGQAKYEHTGASCTPDTPNFLSDFVGSLPSTSCGVGQQMITMSGVTKCFDSEGAEVNVNSASAVAAIVAQGDAAYAAMMADTAARITAMGGTASDVVAAQTVAAGVFSAGGSTGDSSGGDEVMNAFCADNPTASICAEQNFGTVEDVSLTENTINVSITPVAVGGAGSCPAPSPLVLRGQTYYFVWDTYCQFASGIKPILLAFAWLAAGGILIGGFRA